MWVLLVVIHILVCLALMLVILAQTSKGGLDSNFSGMASNVFGGQGASAVIKRATKILFALFVITCLSLAYVANHKRNEGSSIQKKLQKEMATKPAPTPAKTK